MAIDWTASDEHLYAASVAAIRRFAAEHPNEEVCCFAFDTEPRYGYVLIGLDTLSNNIRSVKRRESFAVEQREKMLRLPSAWQHAKYFLRSPVLTAFNTNSGDFAYSQYARVEFPEWREAAERGDYPTGPARADDYLESNGRLVLWRVAERLFAGGAFATLQLASPFLVVYGIHDQEESILRLLNWPAKAEQTVAADRAGLSRSEV
jgi:hypothetical protein